VFRQFFCLGCGALIENEVALDTDPVLRDIEVLICKRMIMSRAEAAE
jgi:acetone carboxylase gamma subunit